MSTAPTFWIEARASGLIAYVLVTCSVVAGLLVKSRPFGPRAVKPAIALETHRFLALMCLGATAVHGSALLLDRTIRITLSDLLVPGTLPYRPVWTGVGVVAAELMLVVFLSFSQRKRIGVKVWRKLHWSTYGLFLAFTVHGVLSGTDSVHPWTRVLYAGCVSAVAGATVWRTLVPPARPLPRAREAGAAGAPAA